MHPESILNGLLQTLQKAREVLMEYFRNRNFYVKEKKHNHLVTEADLKVEEILKVELPKILPQAQFLGEETSNEKLPEADLIWIVDPLDGTTNFVKGFPVFSISVGLFKDQKPYLGAICDVYNNNYYYASLSNGSYLNNERIFCSCTTDFSEAFIATGFPYADFSMLNVYMSVFEELTGKIRGIRRAGSAALDIAWTAQGIFDGFFEYGLKIWDIAAGTIIAKEAGCLFSDFWGNEYNYSGSSVIIANPHIFPLLSNIIKKHLKTK